MTSTQRTNETVNTLKTVEDAAIPDVDACEKSSSSDAIHREAEEEQAFILKYHAQYAIRLFIPVSLCMSAVLAALYGVNSKSKSNIYLLHTPFHEATHTVGVRRLWNALANSMILMCIGIVMLMLFIILYKKRCYKIIRSWLILSSVLLLFSFSFLFLDELLRAYNIPMDYPTVLLIIWNFGVVGILTIHWRGPLQLRQCYIVYIAAQMALAFIKSLPEWTAWTTLSVICLWDLFAVLAPKGPLRILMETAEERSEDIFPALLYSSAHSVHSSVSSNCSRVQEQALAMPLGSLETLATTPVLHDSLLVKFKVREKLSEQTGDEHSLDSFEEYKNITRPRSQFGTHKGRDIKLGIGDFIFYSVLVGKASSFGDWTTTIACFMAILIGLCLTLFLLAVWKKPLPALPISIAFGLIFCFATKAVVTPVIEKFSVNQIFI